MAEKKVHDSKKLPSTISVYRDAIGASLFLFFLLYSYNTITGQYPDTLTSLRHAFGDVFLISLSLFLAFPAFCYFWKRICAFRSYKRVFLFSGIVFGIGNAVISTTSNLFPDAFGSKVIPAWATLVIIVVITCVLAFIGYRVLQAMTRFGTVMWDNLHTLGYLFLIVLTVLITANEWNEWYQWFIKPESILPPVHLPVVTIIFFTIGLRFHMENHKRSSEKENK